MFKKLKKELYHILAKMYGRDYKRYLGNITKETIITNIRERRYIWNNVMIDTKFSIDFIREFKDVLNWKYITRYQNITDEFFIEFKDLIDMEEYKAVHRKVSKEDKIVEMTEYAKTYNLQFDGEYLYAFREHDKWGRGFYCIYRQYANGKYYRDWHCDMRRDIKNSFGFGIWPCGNTPVKVSVDDWGLWVSRYDGKCRVWGFTVIGERKGS